ncbi:MAG: nucleotide exchange factor GrpE [Candidatus Liptonbacteria bacterium RIFOXYC1_FULL_36_8]|uniref:Protein GrpE n=3 Tax=Candidatus Liptoniibacteriota TaxID=1817909 RepID=A0A1G2CMJ9_9BACT|nr:MAG: nucleotide exchange factor GrpE [Candidatus Liptonbacteria bacterium RIFOXYB1_FULL_36_10]OGZ03957.1 MAG: nucleotide exchange factor GrpE [Candidatus Liptonbacteria bacterium RIFOXYC1_FULL_36_8]OGZ04364.1 MAG: nucleotide exchange factor GrpE [Candidatus Liptonbacteria bacterium RIFOXYD1_FULL_36_11]
MEEEKEKEEEKEEEVEEVLKEEEKISDAGEAEKCTKERDEYLLGWKRAKADLANFKKEEVARAEIFSKFANEAFLRDLLAIMDSFDLAIFAEPDNKGLTLIRSQFEGFFTRNGVVVIKALGEKFDPAWHEAVSEIEGTGKESGIIVEVIERGWMLYEKVIRPARVKVSK